MKVEKVIKGIPTVEWIALFQFYFRVNTKGKRREEGKRGGGSSEGNEIELNMGGQVRWRGQPLLTQTQTHVKAAERAQTVQHTGKPLLLEAYERLLLGIQVLARRGRARVVREKVVAHRVRHLVVLCGKAGGGGRGCF